MERAIEIRFDGKPKYGSSLWLAEQASHVEVSGGFARLILKNGEVISLVKSGNDYGPELISWTDVPFLSNDAWETIKALSEDVAAKMSEFNAGELHFKLV